MLQALAYRGCRAGRARRAHALLHAPRGGAGPSSRSWVRVSVRPESALEISPQGDPPQRSTRRRGDAAWRVERERARDRAAIQAYLRQQGESLAVQNDAAELKLRAERRIGELLAETVQKGGDRRSKSYDTTSISRLPDGVSRSQSSRWQGVASIPEPDFEAELARQRAAEAEITTAGMLKLLRVARREGPRAARRRARRE